MVRIFALNSRLDALQEHHLLRQLPAHEQQALQRFRHPADRHRSLLGRAALRTLLGRKLTLAAPDIPLHQGPYGKPVLTASQAPRIEFSIAHSGDWVLVALASQSIGIDIEQQRGPVDPALIRSCFTPAEQAHIRTGADFYRYWTYKEAAIKAIGTGFSLDPLQFEITGHEPDLRIHGHRPLQDCRLVRLTAPSGYHAALAVLGDIGSWAFDVHDIDLLLKGYPDESLNLCNSSH
ncbi:4'-phosphopantetheinyl transferase superfamily protein [Pusillimonas sp. SM2304]|uniref:4'-phosphopantetheinyl transferase family protein n=1 Tax=Pusillimonas sp. SM2304 TaxID=3073241 RepID=UPI0028747927|nr:4'-phosphopantetheinyl transferase superfamily protein [Pusillimonas sp. SM2304]MDS1138864.1 4'-phosphopantetheinyl transferase superfamily protein [Pusillimonas sp. SM2304]